MKAAGLTVEHVIKLLLMANNDLQSIERKCQDLKREEADITAKNLNAAGTFQQLGNDISEEHKILNQYRSSCKEERLELAKLRLQKVKLEFLVKQFQNNNEDFRRIKELVKQAVEQSLTNHRYRSILAFLSVIDSCRRDPVKFNVLYYNMSPAATTTETRLAEFNMIDYYNFGLSPDKQLCYQHKDADDVAYWKFLVDEAEQFFNGRIKELEQLCINRLIEAFISTSISSQLTRKLYLHSEALPSIQTYRNEKEGPLRRADIVTLHSCAMMLVTIVSTCHHRLLPMAFPVVVDDDYYGSTYFQYRLKMLRCFQFYQILSCCFVLIRKKGIDIN